MRLLQLREIYEQDSNKVIDQYIEVNNMYFSIIVKCGYKFNFKFFKDRR